MLSIINLLIGGGRGIPDILWWGCVVRLLTLDLILDKYLKANVREYSPGNSRYHDDGSSCACFQPPPPLFWRLKYFKIENTPIKDTNGKSKFERMLSFLFVEKWELFAMKLSFERIQPCFVHWGSERFACFEQSGATRFLKKPEVHSVYSMVKESPFLLGNFCIYKGFMNLFYIFTTAWTKTTKCAFEIDFLPCAQPI